MNRVPSHTPSAPSADRGREAATVEDAARRDHRDAVADLVDDLRDERHGRDRAGVAARFGALRDHEVAPGLDRRDRVAHLAAHARDEHVAVVEDLHDVARHAEPGDEQRRAAGHDLVRVVEHALGQRREQVDTERLVGRGLRTARHLVVELLRRHRRRAERAETAGVGHRGDDARGTRRRPFRPASRGVRCRASRSVVFAWAHRCRPSAPSISVRA